MKKLADLPPMILTSHKRTSKRSTAKMVSCQLRISIMENTPTMVIAEEISCGMPSLIISRRVSVSLVKRLINSPWVWVSKYLMGKDCIWVNRSVRIFRIAPVEMFTISRLYRYPDPTPMR